NVPLDLAFDPKPRVQLDNFYSLADPYKEMNHDEPTDFFAAVTQSDLVTIERMLKSFPHLIHDSNGFWPHPTPLLVAARSRRALETMKTLLQYGAALDRGDHNGTTVLHYVCEQYPNPVEAIQFLARAGADPNSRDAKKRTPLIVLLQNTHLISTKVLLEAMRTLFKSGAQANVVEAQYQRSALHVAIMHYQPPAILQQQQQQQSHGNGGPVMVAGGIQIGKDLAPVLELLLKRGADVNARDNRKATPLHILLERMDNEELVQMLLLYGADPGLRTTKRNALMIAAEHLRVMSAWFLLENDLLSSAPESIKRATELCSKADGPDKSAKPLLKNTLSDWHGKEGKQRRIQLAQDCVLRVQRTPDMKTIDQTAVALEFLESVGQPIHRASAFPANGGAFGVPVGGIGSNVVGFGVSSSSHAYGTGSTNHHNVSPTASNTH
ncbi:Ankyrin repeat domain-containing protein 61, partial [Mortierella sp. AD032]